MPSLSDERVCRMESLESLERRARHCGAVAALLVTVMALLGLGQALGRPKGRIVGRAYERLPLPFYVGVAVGEIAAVLQLWQPIPLRLSRPLRVATLIAGSLFYGGGLALVVWGRVALGSMYNVSTTQGAELYAEHRLVTFGPFALVRHPMYLGALLGAFGGVLLYRTWSLVLILAHVPVFFIRARREEEALAAEFGEKWQTYARRVPAGIPLLNRPR